MAALEITERNEAGELVATYVVTRGDGDGKGRVDVIVRDTGSP